MFHFHESLRRSFDAFEPTRFRKVKLERIRGGELEIVLGLRLKFDKLGHFAFVVHQTTIRAPYIALLVVNHVTVKNIGKYKM